MISILNNLGLGEHGLFQELEYLRQFGLFITFVIARLRLWAPLSVGPSIGLSLHYSTTYLSE